jgi:CheY-like chemotaxis protein
VDRTCKSIKTTMARYLLFSDGMNRADGVKQGALLIIDDEVAMLNVLKETLESEGYSIYVASNPLEGIKLYAKHWREIKLVLLDYLMPEMTGDVVLQRLRCLNPAARVLLISAHQHLISDKFPDEGVDCLWKVFTLEDLKRRLESMFAAT